MTPPMRRVPRRAGIPPSRKVVRQVASTSAEGRERVAIEQGNGLGRGTTGAAFHHRLDVGRVHYAEALAAA